MTQFHFACAWCGNAASKPVGEVRRSQRLNRKLYCSYTCAGHGNNVSRRAKVVTRKCPVCATVFQSSTRRRAARFCSRVCASKGSVSDVRRKAAQLSGQRSVNFLSAADTLRRRESWKYAALREYLVQQERPHQFELALDGRVFDLALFDVSILVEFDGPYHQSPGQRATDRRKTAIAKKHGYALVRLKVTPSTVIDPVTLIGI